MERKQRRGLRWIALGPPAVLTAVFFVLLLVDIFQGGTGQAWVGLCVAAGALCVAIAAILEHRERASRE